MPKNLYHVETKTQFGAEVTPYGICKTCGRKRRLIEEECRQCSKKTTSKTKD